MLRCVFAAADRKYREPVDLSSGSIVPTLDLRKFTKFEDVELRTCLIVLPLRIRLSCFSLHAYTCTMHAHNNNNTLTHTHFTTTSLP